MVTAKQFAGLWSPEETETNVSAAYSSQLSAVAFFPPLSVHKSWPEKWPNQPTVVLLFFPFSMPDGSLIPGEGSDLAKLEMIEEGRKSVNPAFTADISYVPKSNWDENVRGKREDEISWW